MALALKRKAGEAIKIGADIVVTIGETRGSYTTVLVEAPKDIPVARIEGKTDDNANNTSATTRKRRTERVVQRRNSADRRDS